jgi:hypothetical protein
MQPKKNLPLHKFLATGGKPSGYKSSKIGNSSKKQSDKKR